MAFRIFALLLDRAVGIAFVTKGRIPERHMELLCSYPALVQTQIGVITPDEVLARRLEPNAAPPSLRFEQMQRLIHAGIETRMRVAPIIPSLTDTEATLDTLFGNAAASGVSRASINALHIRPAIVASLRKHLERHEARSHERALCVGGDLAGTGLGSDEAVPRRGLMKADMGIQRLEAFKESERPETVLVVAGQSDLLRIVVAWMQTEVSRVRRLTRLQGKSETQVWA
ncbi:MAG: hypothetical protein IT364_21850 [Candidatus Hydrogenedentes bacterium]|nr:hypothetical protein [Candidatus Hydrogenedentota bacterium]